MSFSVCIRFIIDLKNIPFIGKRIDQNIMRECNIVVFLRNVFLRRGIAERHCRLKIMLFYLITIIITDVKHQDIALQSETRVLNTVVENIRANVPETKSCEGDRTTNIRSR